MEVNTLQIFNDGEGSDTLLGFKMMGVQTSGRRVRVWVRRKRGKGRHIWHRYLEPVAESKVWEVVLHEQKGTGAMTLVNFNQENLDRFASDYSFSAGAVSLQSLKALDESDPLFRRMVAWGIEVIGTDAQGST